ncbi:MAG: sigma-70 family RNA polymerase sigma factor [Candidatus Eisenbacteria bacterium]|uniref:RNA polymerase sigma factor n=1 Tax=Eiseniibacteriota bacterium TaxID=2212470 RepID=A0A7Y2E8J3_UNCEI|nr:sigma-70 family RNA polymerase sigma factor [Candidatus Eisenbacteria bacterium]
MSSLEAILKPQAFFRDMPDEDLMDHVVTGSEAAFSCLVDRYKNRLQNVIYRYTRDFQRAEDLTQEAFVRVYLHRERYRKTGKFSTWIFTIAVNLAKNEVRRKVRLRGVMSLDHLKELLGTSESFLKDDKPETDRSIERDQTSSVISQAIAKLPEVYRDALVLRDIQELSYEEIGEILDIPGGTVRSRINRARLMLKDKLKSFARSELST